MPKIKTLAKSILTCVLNPTLFFKSPKVLLPSNNIYVAKSFSCKGLRYLNIEKNVRIGKNMKISCYDSFAGQNYKPQITIKSGCYFGDNIRMLCNSELTFENNVLMANDIFITTENHGITVSQGGYGHQPLSASKVVFGENCWIGNSCIILPGVQIGKWSIIGAGSVVTHSVPDFCIAVGNPAKIIKKYDFEQNKWVPARTIEE